MIQTDYRKNVIILLTQTNILIKPFKDYKSNVAVTNFAFFNTCILYFGIVQVKLYDIESIWLQEIPIII